MCADNCGRLARGRRLRAVVVLVAALGLCGGGVCLYARNPAEPGLYPPCLFHALTGLYCPGCGTLRALHQLMHGNVRAALCLNPLTVVLLPMVAYGMLSLALQTVGARPLPAPLIPARWIWTLLAVILLYWGLRNIPVYPFSLLAPHSESAGRMETAP